MQCEKCGAEYGLGDWPFCGGGHGRASVAVQPDELIGGFVQENFGHEPEYFTSKKAMLRRADELNLRQIGDGDKKSGKYAVTAKTLEDARVLLSRGSQTTDTATCQTASFTIREVAL